MESRKHRLTRRPFLLTVLCALAIVIAAPCAAFADDAAEKTAQPTGETPASIAIDGSATNLVQSDEAATLGVTLGQNTPESGASSIALDNTPSTLAAAENSYIPLPVNALVVQSEHQAMLDKVNALRASQGVAPLTWNSNLTGAAMQRAIEIALRFSHTRPHGDLCYTANPEIYGENIAYALIPKGNSSTDLIYEGWRSSSGHSPTWSTEITRAPHLATSKPTSASEWSFTCGCSCSHSPTCREAFLRATASAPLSFPCRLTQPKA